MTAPKHLYGNGVMPLELEMRVEEEDEDDPDSIESKPFIKTSDELQEGRGETSTSLDSTTFHEEVDIKEEANDGREVGDEDDADEQILQPPLAVNIKEEQDEEDDDEGQSYAENESYYEEDQQFEEAQSSHTSNLAMVAGSQGNEGFMEENASKLTEQPNKRFRHGMKRVDTVYRCPNCSLCYTSAQYLAGHIRRGCRFRPSPIKNAYSCIECGQGFNNYGDLFQHKRQKHDQPPTTATDPKIAAQTRAERTKSSRKYNCSNCPRTFTAPGYLMQHQKSHLRSQTDHSCDVCGEDFDDRTLDEKEEHYIEKHPTHERYKCEKCQKVYTQRLSLMIHFETHEDRMCKVCCKKFPNQRCLSLHQRVHTSSKGYQCNLCLKTYIHMARYFEHRRKEHNINEFRSSEPEEEESESILPNDDEDAPSGTSDSASIREAAAQFVKVEYENYDVDSDDSNESDVSGLGDASGAMNLTAKRGTSSQSWSSVLGK